jgi:hypothetical protein
MVDRAAALGVRDVMGVGLGNGVRKGVGAALGEGTGDGDGETCGSWYQISIKLVKDEVKLKF